MFNAGALKKVACLIRGFSRRDARWRAHGRLGSWEDFRRLPVSDRNSLKAFCDAGLVKEAFSVTATSGSTSSRLVIAHSRESYEAHLRRLVKLYRLAGVRKGMLCLNLCSYELNSGGRLMDAAFKAAGAGVIAFGPVSTPLKVQEAAVLIRQLKPVLINAYTNQLFDLFTALGLQHTIRRCLVNGEPLWPDYRKRIERLGGVRIHDHYGAMEISGLAVALKPDDKYMRVVDDGLLLEVMDASGKASATGRGDLLATDMDNTSMPFIRYRVGDEVELIRRRGSLWIKVFSRSQDSLLINGVVVMKQELVRAVNDLLGHPRFFFVVDKHPVKYYDKLIINVAHSNGKPDKILVPAVINMLGLDHCVDVRTHAGAIPRTMNGKIRYFIDARKKV